MRQIAMSAASFLVFLLPAGCILEPPQYSDTEFACAEPSDTCPGGYVCIEQICRPEGYTSDPSTPDAGGLPDARPQAPDATPSPPDATPSPPDATPPPLQTVILKKDETDDTYLHSENPNQNYGDRQLMRADPSPEKYILLRFDVSSIPVDAVVESAELTVEISETLESGNFVAHRMLEDWEPLEATWYQRKVGALWSAAGAGPGTYEPTPLFSFAAPNLTTYTVQLPVSTVQAWVNQSVPNYGMRWMSNSPEGGGGDVYTSNADVNRRPQLQIQYRVPPTE